MPVRRAGGPPGAMKFRLLGASVNPFALDVAPTSVPRPVANGGPIRLHLEAKRETIMCRRTTCRHCGKPNWAGCGAHIDAVLHDVPVDERCRCREERAAQRHAGGQDGVLDKILSGLGLR